MIDVKNLTRSQIIELKLMSSFNCNNIVCEDCPLNYDGRDCGSTIAENIIAQYDKETKQ